MKLNFKLLFVTCIFLSTSLLNATSAGKVFLRSLLVPGWGELYQNNNSGYAFITSEIMLISSVFYFNQEAKNYNNKAFNYAVTHAGIPKNSKNNDFYLDLIGKYNSSGYEKGGYGDFLLRIAQNSNPNATIEDNIYVDEMPWQWSSKKQRGTYKQMRKDSDYSKDWAKTLTGAIVLNHILSGANSIRIFKKQKRLQFNAGILPNNTLGVFANYKF